MSKRKTNGFSLEILGYKCYVFFKYFKDGEITKCHLKVEDYTKFDFSIEEGEFIGMTTLKDPDVISKETGEKLALQKAIDKFMKKVILHYEKLCLEKERLCVEVNDKLNYKLNKIIKTNKPSLREYIENPNNLTHLSKDTKDKLLGKESF